VYVPLPISRASVSQPQSKLPYYAKALTGSVHAFLAVILQNALQLFVALAPITHFIH
jgi:hypothetical protein